MLALKGTCTNCKGKIDVMSPGVVCYDCEKFFHGLCLNPSQDYTSLINFIVLKKRWFCPICSRKQGNFLEARTSEDMKNMSNKLDIVLQLRKLFDLIKHTMDEMVSKCNELDKEALAQKRENNELKKRIKLHAMYGKRWDTISEWLSLRKLLMINEYSKPKRPYETKFDKSREKNLINNRKLLERHIRYDLAFKMRTTEKRPVHIKRPDENKKSGKVISKRRIVLWFRLSVANFAEHSFLHILIWIIVLVYILLGAFVFFHVEGSYEQTLSDDILKKRLELCTEIREKNAHDKLLKYYDFLAEWFQINNNLLKLDGKYTWNFLGSLFFCISTCTTIGYGDVTPITRIGKILTIIYAFIGIPLCLILVTSLGKTLSNFMLFLVRTYYKSPTRTTLDTFHIMEEGKNFDDEDNLSIVLIIFLMLEITYISIGGAILMWSNYDWNFFDAIYFVLISVTTIGFGDYVLTNQDFMTFFIVYVIVGLGITTMGIALVATVIRRKLRKAIQKLGVATMKYFD